MQAIPSRAGVVVAAAIASTASVSCGSTQGGTGVDSSSIGTTGAMAGAGMQMAQSGASPTGQVSMSVPTPAGSTSGGSTKTGSTLVPGSTMGGSATTVTMPPAAGSGTT